MINGGGGLTGVLDPCKEGKYIHRQFGLGFSGHGQASRSICYMQAALMEECVNYPLLGGNITVTTHTYYLTVSMDQESENSLPAIEVWDCGLI